MGKNIFNIFLFLIALSFCLFIFLPGGRWKDGDSDSYAYLLKGQWTSRLPDLKRPIVFPVYLLFIDRINKILKTDIYVLLNSILAATSACLIAVVVFKKTSSRFFQTITMLVFLFDYQIQKYINYQNPEVLFTFFLSLFIYYIVKIKIFVQKTQTINLMILLTILIFTKPILLYFPIIIFGYAAYLFTKRILSKTKFKFFFFVFFITYILPVFIWSMGNKIRHNYFIFSDIQLISIAGVLNTYSLLDHGLETICGIPCRQIFYKETGIYHKIKLLNDFYLIDGHKISKYQLLYKSVLITLNARAQEFFIKSVKKIPSIITDINFGKDYFCGVWDRTDRPIWIAQQCFYWQRDVYFRLYQKVFRVIFNPVAIFIWSICVFITITYEKKQKNGAPLLLILALWLYVITIMGFTAYEQYARIRSPFDQIIIILVMLGIFRAYTYIRTHLANNELKWS